MITRPLLCRSDHHWIIGIYNKPWLIRWTLFSDYHQTISFKLKFSYVKWTVFTNSNTHLNRLCRWQWSITPHPSYLLISCICICICICICVCVCICIYICIFIWHTRGHGQLHLIHPIYLYLAHVRFDGPTIFLTYSLSCIAIINAGAITAIWRKILFRASLVEILAIVLYHGH